MPQGSNVDQLRAYARKQWTYFKYGTNSPSETAFAKLSESVQNSWQWVLDQLSAGSDAAKKTAGDAKDKVKEEL